MAPRATSQSAGRDNRRVDYREGKKPFLNEKIGECPGFFFFVFFFFWDAVAKTRVTAPKRFIRRGRAMGHSRSVFEAKIALILLQAESASDRPPPDNHSQLFREHFRRA